jgi:hypothetical protein
MTQERGLRVVEGGDTGPPLSIDVLWKMLQRDDALLAAVNTKGAVLAVFNTFVLAVGLKWTDLLSTFGRLGVLRALAALLLVVMTGASLVSLFATFRALAPYLKSPRIPKQYQSLLFFSHVAEFDLDSFCANLRAADEEQIKRDIEHQRHALSQGLHLKYNALATAVRAIRWGSLPAGAGLLLLKLGSLLALF